MTDVLVFILTEGAYISEITVFVYCSLMSLDFCLDIQMVESEFGVHNENMDALLPLCRLVVEV